jgi:hypothetical protein
VARVPDVPIPLVVGFGRARLLEPVVLSRSAMVRADGWRGTSATGPVSLEIDPKESGGIVGERKEGESGERRRDREVERS